MEDSVVSRELLVTIFQNSPDLQVIGTARNGVEAVRLAKRLKPDVITMDVYMPEMDGLEASRQIMQEAPCPIVIISNGLENSKERNLTFNALKAGALSVMKKPTVDDTSETHQGLVNQVKLMSEVKVVRHWDRGTKEETRSESRNRIPVLKQGGSGQAAISQQPVAQLITIASSTGGPGVLAEILSKLPADFPIPILIVQHITSGFAQGLAEWLDRQAALEVRLARHGDKPEVGQVLIAPDNSHMIVNDLGLIALIKEQPDQGLRPAANRLFRSVAQVYGAAALGIILTGMGSDGAEGLRDMHNKGAYTIAQDEASCVVFGMPAVAIQLGAVDLVLPASQIAKTINAMIGKGKR